MAKILTIEEIIHIKNTKFFTSEQIIENLCATVEHFMFKEEQSKSVSELKYYLNNSQQRIKILEDELTEASKNRCKHSPMNIYTYGKSIFGGNMCTDLDLDWKPPTHHCMENKIINILADRLAEMDNSPFTTSKDYIRWAEREEVEEDED